MLIKLLSKVTFFWAFILTSALGWGQCPTSVSVSSNKGNTICAETPVEFTANVNGGTEPFKYEWKIDGTTVGTNSSKYSTSDLENGDKVTVTITSADTAACSISSSSYTMTVNANKTPTVSVSANKSSICPGESVTFTATNTNGGTSPKYSFFLNDGTSALQTGSSSTFTTTSLNNGDKVQVVLTSNLECVTTTTAKTSSNNITVRAGTPAVPGTISGLAAVCPATSQTYSINAVAGATSYQWTLPSGWSGSSNSNSINVTAGTSNGTISVKAINDCGTSEAQNIAITVKAGTPAVPGTITGSTSVCPDVSQTYSITAISGATEYIWSLPSGWSGTSTTNSITVTTGSSGSGNISVQAKNECGTSTAKSLAVAVKPGTPVKPETISGTAAVCPGTQQTYSITSATGATSYIWSLPNGWTGTSTTNSITATSGATGGNITVKATNDCGTSTEQTFAVTIKPGTPAVPGAVSGSNLVCPGTSETYSISPVNGATEYIWTLPNGWTGTSSSETITVTTGQSGNGNIIVKAKNDCGTSTASNIAVSVDKPAPIMSGTVTGPVEVCSTATGLVYSIPAITNATEYLWTLPPNWNITAGEGTRTITVSANSSSGNVSVNAKNSCGESSPSQVLAVNSTTGIPATPGTITAPNLPTNAICPPATGLEFNVPTVAGADSYLWTLPNGWEITSGSGTNSIVVRVNATAATTSNASVSVEAVNICGNSAKTTLSGIAIDSHVVTNAGTDQTVCKLIAAIDIVGDYSFSGTNKNLKPTWSVGTGLGSFGDASKLTTTFTPSQAALDAGSVILTLTTDAPSGACGPGKDEIKISFKALPTATITATSPVCNGNTSTLTFTGTPNSRITYRLPNNTTQTVDIGTSGTTTVTTAALTANSTYTLVSAVNLDTPACTYTFSTSASTTVTVTPKPTASISYAGPFCSSLSTAQPVTLTGTHAYTGGVFSSTEGLTIDPSSGAITPISSTPGTYNVSYNTPEAGDCAEVTATTEVIITKAPTATINYTDSPFCTSDTAAQSVTLTGTDGFSGGTFSAPEGLTINSSTGAINASSSTSGTYIVTYNTPAAGGCTPVTATTEVKITKEPTVTISYPEGPFCLSDTSSKPVTITGTDAYTGGTYSAPAGLSINSSTGEINLSASTVGTHTVTYTSPATSGCGEVTATTNITITQTPSAELKYAGPYCTSDATAHLPEFTNTSGTYEGGVFRSTPDGLSIDPTTGAINAQNSSPNTYMVFYELPAGAGCGTSEIQTSVTITQVPQLEIDYTTPLCTSDTSSYTVTFSENAKGAYQNGSFTATSGLAIDSEGNIIAANSTPGIHTITYTTPDANGCGPVVVTTQVEVFEKPFITTPPVNVGICSTEPASFEVVASGDNLTYQWKRVDGAAITNATGVNTAKLSFNNATETNAGEYFVEIAGSSPCGTVSSDPVTLNIDENIVIIKPTEDEEFCDQERADVTFEFIAHANGEPLEFTWIKDGADLPSINSDRLTYEVTGPTDSDGRYSGTLKISNPNPTDNGVYAVRISGPDYFTCSEATSKTFTLSVTPLPEPPTTEPVVLCQGETAAPLSASGVTGATFKWYDANMQLIEGVPTPSTVEAGNTSFFVTQTTEVCESAPTELIVTVNPTPALPTTQEVINYCFEEADIPALSATGTDTNAVINWYGPNDPSKKLTTAPTPVTTSTGNTQYWVSQSIGECESELVEITVTIDPLPELGVSADNQLICAGSSTILHATGAASYTWTLNGAEVGTTADLTVTPSETSTYVLTGTNTAGCINATEITIEVDEPTVPGTLTGPESVCVTSPNGTLTLSGYTGEIQRWEKSTDGSTWTNIAETTETLNFSNLTAATSYRAIVRNGVCGELSSNQVDISIDPLPVGGKLAFETIVTSDNDGRIFIICEENDPGYADPLSLLGSEGQVAAWRYRGASDTSWSVVTDGAGGNFTGEVLLGSEIESILNANRNSAGKIETTAFRVELKSGACSISKFSETAIVSVIPSTIEPTPVEVDPKVVCIGESINLYAETGYENGTINPEDGLFNNSSITNNGWRIRREGSTEDRGFSSSANNTVPDFWLRTNPKSFLTATKGETLFSSDGLNNNPFVIIGGNHPATLEPPVFNLDGTDQAILTFDQAYDLTEGASIRIEISTNGGASYNTDQPLYELFGPASSGNYSNFGAGPAGINQMKIDLGEYIGQNNLRIRFRFLGKRNGDVWAFDNLNIPDGPRDVTIEWNDYTDPENPIFIGNSGTETWTPTKIGLNTFVVKTLLTTNSKGEQCDVIQHEEKVEVFVYDSYTSTPAAAPIACGTNSFELTTTVTGGKQGLITNYPTADGYAGYWEIVESPEGYVYDEAHFFGGVANPTTNFTPDVVGNFTLRWTLELEDETAVSECENDINEVELNIFDQYTSTATATVEACGDNSVQLAGLLNGVLQGDITTLPTRDGTYGEWQVINGPQGYVYDENQFSSSNTSISAINDPSAIFTPTLVGNYTLRWAIINENNAGCEHSVTDVSITVYDNYTSTATAELDTCETNSFNLNAIVSGALQGDVSSFPTPDATSGQWIVTGSPEGYEFSESHFTGGITDPNAVFTPVVLGEYTLTWTLVNENLPGECIVPATVSFKLFDSYTLTAEAEAGSCGDFSVQLTGTTAGIWQENITYPTQDGYVGRWSVSGGDGTFSNPDPEDVSEPVNNPNAVFTANAFGNYTFIWELVPDPNFEGEFMENTSCPAISAEISIEIKECIALDFDGIDDFVDLGEGYTENYSLEAWILPKETGGTIISGPTFNITTPAGVSTSKWTHVAVSNGNLYLDGVLQTGISVTGNGGAKTLIGARWTEGGATDFFHGWIEEVRIWNGEISQENIRFTMNQRLKAAGNIGVIVDMDHPDSPEYSKLAGYYQLLATEADILPGGFTPDLANTIVNGKLVNMETLQENTAPLPYFTASDGSWDTPSTWARPGVWKLPNSTGINWNIVRISHNVTANRDISVLGLISETGTLEMQGENPNSWTTGGSGNPLHISHYLLLNGIIDLNGESQLLQPMRSIVDASSSGHLDRDQQGTASSYNYNYWSSPVSPEATYNTVYTVGGILMDGTTPGTPQPIDFGATYAHADGSYNGNKRISTYWLFKFHGTANNYFEWAWIGAGEPLEVGEGFSMKGTTGSAAIENPQNYTFRGLPNNGDISPGTVGPDENYLIGNPYPSAIDANMFIRDHLKAGGNQNNVFNGTIYFWSHFSGATHYLQEYIGGYATYNLSGGTIAYANDERINATGGSGGEIPQQFIPVGQGFFVNTMIDESLKTGTSESSIQGGQILFKNEYRVYETEVSKARSVFHSADDKNDDLTFSSNEEADPEQSKIWLKFKSPMGYHRQILVTADKNASDNFDLGYDAPLIEDNAEDMYWFFNDYEFVIQGVADFNLERELQIGMKVSKKGALTISIDELHNIPADMNIFLEDSLKQVVHDLREKDYHTTSEEGVFTDRFKIVFKDKNEVEPEEPPIIEIGDFEILYVNGTREILVRNPKLIQIKSIYLNNLMGQQIMKFYDIPVQEEVQLPVKRFSSGVYIIKVHSEQGISTKKVILE